MGGAMCPAIIVESWHWCLFGIALMVLELFIPASFLIWVGVAALGTGLLTHFHPFLPLSQQILFFLFASLGLAWLSRSLGYPHKRKKIKIVRKPKAPARKKAHK